MLRQLRKAQSALTVQDLVDLAQTEDPPTHLSKMYDWYFERTMATIKLAFGAAGASFAALIGVIFKADSETAAWLLFAAVVVSSLAGVIQIRLLAQFHREFAVSQRLLKRIGECLKVTDPT